MAFVEDPTAFLEDFGVPVTAGAISGLGILDMPSEYVADGIVLSTEYSLRAAASAFGGLHYGDAIRVNGINYQVREVHSLDDGVFVELSLTKLAPESTAPGGQPRQFGLSDLADVNVTDPAIGEVLKYDGTQWVDAQDSGAAYVHTQTTPAATWTINHNLGHVPSVELFDSGSQEIDADVSHPTMNTTTIVFSIPTAGFARLI